MFQWRLFLVLLRPSFLSTIATMVLGVGLFSTIGWAYITQSPVFYDYFFGPEGIQIGAEETSGQAQLAFSSLISQSWVYNIVIFIGAILVGVLVYILLQALARIMVTVSETIEEVQGGDSSSKHQVEKEIALRFILRIFIIVLWIGYAYITMRIAVPFCVSLFGDSIAMLPAFTGVLNMLLAFATFFIAVHIHVIFLRLLLLRPRVFGGDYVIAGAIEGY